MITPPELKPPAVFSEDPGSLTGKTFSGLYRNLPPSDPNGSHPSRGVLRVTNSVAQYDVSRENPQALSNIGKALAGSLDRDDFTYFDPESRKDIRLGDVLVAVDLSNPEEVVLTHRDSAGKGALGRVACSMSFMSHNPITTIAMKTLGIVADPEVIYKQKVVQILAQLDREGLFGPPGASTFNLLDWEVGTRNAWRDVVIRRAPSPEDAAQLPGLEESLARSFSVTA